jgi:hypothetical protein
MSLKKNLKTAQASLEYFIIFALIGGLTILGTSTFLSGARQSGQDLFFKAVDRINTTSTTTTMTWAYILQHYLRQSSGGYPTPTDPVLLDKYLYDPWNELIAMYGYTINYPGSQVNIGANQTLYFVIDPFGMGLSFESVSIWIWDYAAGNNLLANVYLVDNQGNQIGDQPIASAQNNQLNLKSYPGGSNLLWIVEVTELNGEASTPIDVCWAF